MAAAPSTSAGCSQNNAAAKNLICGVCQDVYRDPRLLPCHHSFCRDCLQKLIDATGNKARSNYRKSFLCPHCRKDTPVPGKGAGGFQCNFHLNEKDLEDAREGGINCSVHPREALLFFCTQCDQPVCYRCKLTKHEDHRKTQDLAEAAQICRKRLENSEGRLDQAIDYLEDMMDVAREDADAAEGKTEILIKQAKDRRDVLLKKINLSYKDAVKDIEAKAADISQSLKSKHQKIKRKLDGLCTLRKRVLHSLGRESSDIETVLTEREMREGKGSEEQLVRAKQCVPITSKRPRLDFNTHTISDDAIRQFIGSPSQLSVPFEKSKEVAIREYRHVDDANGSPKIYSIYYNHEEKVTIMSSNNTVIKMPDDESSDVEIVPTNKRQVFGHSGVSYPHKFVHNGKECLRLFSKRTSLYEVSYNNDNGKCAIYKVKQTKTGETAKTTKLEYNSDNFLFYATANKPVAFDVNDNGDVFVLIQEKPASLSTPTTSPSSLASSSSTSKAEPPPSPSSSSSLPQPSVSSTQDTVRKREVNLYRKGNRYQTPFTTYESPDGQLDPADVCFWLDTTDHGDNFTDKEEMRLLIADRENDRIHVVAVENDQAKFVRYLAVGNKSIIHPTALGLDDYEEVWVGCETGSVFTCIKSDRQSGYSSDSSSSSSE